MLQHSRCMGYHAILFILKLGPYYLIVLDLFQQMIDQLQLLPQFNHPQVRILFHVISASYHNSKDSCLNQLHSLAGIENLQALSNDGDC